MRQTEFERTLPVSGHAGRGIPAPSGAGGAGIVPATDRGIAARPCPARAAVPAAPAGAF